MSLQRDLDVRKVTWASMKSEKFWNSFLVQDWKNRSNFVEWLINLKIFIKVLLHGEHVEINLIVVIQNGQRLFQ